MCLSESIGLYTQSGSSLFHDRDAAIKLIFKREKE